MSLLVAELDLVAVVAKTHVSFVCLDLSLFDHLLLLFDLLVLSLYIGD